MLAFTIQNYLLYEYRTTSLHPKSLIIIIINNKKLAFENENFSTYINVYDFDVILK